LDDNCHVRAEDHAILAQGASIFVDHLWGEKPLSIQRIGLAQDVLGADVYANPTIDNPFTCLPQYVNLGQFSAFLVQG